MKKSRRKSRHCKNFEFYNVNKSFKRHRERRREWRRKKWKWRKKKECRHNNDDINHQKCIYFAEEILSESDVITKLKKEKKNQIDYNHSRWKTIITQNQLNLEKSWIICHNKWKNIYCDATIFKWESIKIQIVDISSICHNAIFIKEFQIYMQSQSTWIFCIWKMWSNTFFSW